MNKKNKILLSIFLVVVVIAGGFFLYEANHQKETPEDPKQNEVNPTKTTVEGTVKEIHGTSILLVVNDKELSFTYTSDSIKEQAKIAVNDQVSIEYIQDDKKDEQVALAIILQKAHKETMDEFIANMSLEEKVGQMVLARCPNENAVEDVKEYHLGGYMLFDRDVKDENKASLSEKLTSYQGNADIPLLIAIDEEGGTVNRLSRYTAFRGVPFHSPQSLFQEGGMELILSDNKEKAELLQSLGIQVNLAPVCDVSTNPDDFIYARSFGQDAQSTANYIKEIVTQSKELGMGTTLKHFPGYGDNVDTHTGIAYDDRSLEYFEENDILPFIAGIEAGADSILVSHNVIQAMDPTMPASLSEGVHRFLRSTLGFEGVIMTDDLDMQAIDEFTDYDTSAVTAIQAGNDLVLCSNYKTQIPAILAAVQQGDIDESQIDQSVLRILTWKKKLNISTQ